MCFTKTPDIKMIWPASVYLWNFGDFWFDQSDANFKCIFFLFDKSIKGFPTYIEKPNMVDLWYLIPLISKTLTASAWFLTYGVFWGNSSEINCPNYSLVSTHMYLYTKLIYLFIMLNQVFDHKWMISFAEVLFV